MKSTVLVGFVVAAAAACSTAQDLEPSAALQSLGVSKLSIVETDTLLEIEALREDGVVVGAVALRVGEFYMAEDDRGNVFGRQLSVMLGDDRTKHESEGMYPLQLPAPAEPSLGVLLSEPLVAAELGQRGIEVDAKPPFAAQVDWALERPYGACEDIYGTWTYSSTTNASGCTTSTFGGCGGTAVMAYDSGYGEYFELRCCDSGNRATRACKSGGGTTACGPAGGNGCAVCWDSPTPWGGYCYTSTNGGGQCYSEWCTIF